MSVSDRTVERLIFELADNVNQQHLVALRKYKCVQCALDESVDINGIPCLAVSARFSDTEVHKMSSLKTVNDYTKGNDKLKAFTDHFENREDIGKIFITTDGAPVMVGKIKALQNG
ncbi:uncharacterized protein [Palaemon carinicauda]|uniref:uncharacterized protein n=1 Tax=Palaemon carinicauda TaxID=392227 RepID=UPI0035B5C59A